MGIPKEFLQPCVERNTKIHSGNVMERVNALLHSQTEMWKFLTEQDPYALLLGVGSSDLDVILPHIIKIALAHTNVTHGGAFRERILAECAKVSGHWEDVIAIGESKTIQGRKIKGVDLLLFSKKALYALQIKAGIHAQNSSSKAGHEVNTNSAVKLLNELYGDSRRIIPVLFYTVGHKQSKAIYGRDKKTGKRPLRYLEMQGQFGWKFCTGDPLLYQNVGMILGAIPITNPISAEKFKDLCVTARKTLHDMTCVHIVDGREHLKIDELIWRQSGNLHLVNTPNTRPPKNKKPHPHLNFLLETNKDRYPVGTEVLADPLTVSCISHSQKPLDASLPNAESHRVAGHTELHGLLILIGADGIRRCISPLVVQHALTEPINIPEEYVTDTTETMFDDDTISPEKETP